MGTTFQTGNAHFFENNSSWTTGSALYMGLCTSGYTPNPDHDDMGDITNELSGGNYARVALTSLSVVIDDANNQIELDCADVTFTALGAAAGNPTQAVTHLSASGGDANSILHVVNDLTAPPAPNGGDYVIQPSAEGLIKLAS